MLPVKFKKYLKMQLHGCELSLQSCPTLYNPMDFSLPASSVHGDSPGKILEGVAISYSRGSS